MFVYLLSYIPDTADSEEIRTAYIAQGYTKMRAFEHSDKRRSRSCCTCRSNAASRLHILTEHYARHQARVSEDIHEYRAKIACFRVFLLSQLDQRRVSATRKRWMTRPVHAYAHTTQARQ
jgi:hypothetical protein